MSGKTTTVWKCSLCGLAVVEDGSDRPEDWHGYYHSEDLNFLNRGQDGISFDDACPECMIALSKRITAMARSMAQDYKEKRYYAKGGER